MAGKQRITSWISTIARRDRERDQMAAAEEFPVVSPTAAECEAANSICGAAMLSTCRAAAKELACSLTRNAESICKQQVSTKLGAAGRVHSSIQQPHREYFLLCL